MYKNLPTHKKVLADHHFKNLELQSHLLIVVYMNLAESLRLLHKDPPRLGIACASLLLFGSFVVQNLPPENYMN
jgi:hypothetical protein